MNMPGASSVTVGQFRSPGMTTQVTAAGVDPDGHVVIATAVDTIDQTIDWPNYFDFISSDVGAILEVAADGLRVGSQALDVGLGGGGSDKIRLDMTGLNSVASVLGTDEVWISRAGVNHRIAQADFISGLSLGTDITTTPSPTQYTINSSTGTGDTIGLVGGGNAGLMSPADKSKLDAGTDISTTPSATDYTINSSTGTGDTIALVGANAGLMSPADKSKLDGLSGTDITTTPSTTAITIDSSTGTGDTIDLVGANAGLMAPADKTNLDALDTKVGRWITPFDFGAIGDGVADDAAAIQAMFDWGVANNHYWFEFPPATYLVGSDIDLPYVTGSQFKKTYISGYGAILQSGAANVVLFRRDIPGLAPSPTTSAVPVIEGISFRGFATNSATGGVGIRHAGSSGLVVRNCDFQNFTTAVQLYWAQNALLEGNTGNGCLTTYEFNDGAENRIPGGTFSNSGNHNVAINSCSTNMSDASAIGIKAYNTGTLRIENLIAQGTACDTPVFISHRTDETTPQTTSRRQTVIDTMYTEFSSSCTTIIRAELRDANLFVSNVKLTIRMGTPLTRLIDDMTSIRSTITFNNISDLVAWSSTEPWFDNYVPGNTTQRNTYVFNDVIVDADKIDDAVLWANGVPAALHYEMSDLVSDEVLIGPLSPNSFWANPGTSPGRAKEIGAGSLPLQTTGPLSRFLGWSDIGALVVFDPNALQTTGKQDGVDDLGNVTGTATIDFEANFNNKLVTVTGDVVLNFTSTVSGKYQLRIKFDDSGTKHNVTIDTAQVTMRPQMSRIPVVPDNNEITILNLNYDATTDEWHW